MGEWRSIKDHPDRPMPVLFHYGLAPYPAEVLQDDVLRYDLGHWDGTTWLEAGTNHEVFEWGEEGDADLPQHWAPLLPPPPSNIDKDGQNG